MSNENEMTAQAAVIYPDYLRPYNIGDTDINWVASDGDPSSVAGASITDSASFNNTDEGVWLTPAADAQVGYLYWNKNYDYTKSFIITATTRAGGGDGADGMTIFFGASDGSTSSSNQGGMSIYLDEYNGDVVTIWKSGSQVGDTYLALKTLDNNTYNYWEVVYEYVDATHIYLHVRMNQTYVTRLNIAPFTPSGNYIGISGVCGSDNNVHSVKSFCVKSARAWLHYNF